MNYKKLHEFETDLEKIYSSIGAFRYDLCDLEARKPERDFRSAEVLVSDYKAMNDVLILLTEKKTALSVFSKNEKPSAIGKRKIKDLMQLNDNIASMIRNKMDICILEMKCCVRQYDVPVKVLLEYKVSKEIAKECRDYFTDSLIAAEIIEKTAKDEMLYMADRAGLLSCIAAERDWIAEARYTISLYAA